MSEKRYIWKVDNSQNYVPQMTKYECTGETETRYKINRKYRNSVAKETVNHKCYDNYQDAEAVFRRYLYESERYHRSKMQESQERMAQLAEGSYK